MICKSCKIDKHPTLFGEQWSKASQKYYKRLTCRTCCAAAEMQRRRIKNGEPYSTRKKKSLEPQISKQKKIEVDVPPKEKEDNLPPKEYVRKVRLSKTEKYCNGCKEILPIEFFKGLKRIKAYSKCLECRRSEEKLRSNIILEKNGGTQRYSMYPNEYLSEQQKKTTHNFMLLLGWQFNKDKGIWYKDGIKTDQGIFINIKHHTKEQVEINNKGRNNRIKDLMTPVVNELKKFRKDGYTCSEIAEMYGVSKKVIENWTKK